jgi:hypothetical protein
MARPASGAQLALALTSVSLMVSGTPAALPLALPMLARMSLRTTPLTLRMLGPLVPSPG